MNTIPYTLQGIPCLLEIVSFTGAKPWSRGIESCPSSDDFYGYEDIEFEVLDRKGYKAKWLAKKVDKNEEKKIEETISNYMSQNDEP